MTFALLLIAVIAVALIARAASRGSTRSSDPRAWLAGQDVPPPPAPPPPPPVEELAGRAIAPPSSEAVEASPEDDEETGDVEAMAYAATTLDGWGFIPEGDGVAVSRTDHLDPGQFVAAQVRRQEADSGYWLLEVLGREEIEMESGTCWPYGVWSFRSKDAALAAVALLRRRIVRPPPDENGKPRAFTAEDFEKSRRLVEEPLPDSEPAGDDVPAA